MTNIKNWIQTFLFIFLGTTAGLFILISVNNKSTQQTLSTKAADFETPIPTLTQIPIPTPTVVLPSPIETVYSISPDGTSQLIMNKQHAVNHFHYTFLTTNSSANTRQLILDQTVNDPLNFTTPFNTWSPDDKYVFLKESGPAGDNYYVLNANGSLFSDNSQFINVSDIFLQKLTNYTMTEITGWAANSLLVVNTKTKEGAQGPSFWFDISSRSFIQLSTHFG